MAETGNQRGKSHAAEWFPVGPLPVITAPANRATAAGTVVSLTNTKWSYEELTHPDRMPMPIPGKEPRRQISVRYAIAHKEGF